MSTVLPGELNLLLCACVERLKLLFMLRGLSGRLHDCGEWFGDFRLVFTLFWNILEGLGTTL